jgi:hypothetical protein
MSDKRQTIVIAVDIEKTGDRLMADKIISIGLRIGYPEAPLENKSPRDDISFQNKGWLIETKRFNFQVEWFRLQSQETKEYNIDQKTYGDFEPRCVDEFWCKQPYDIIEDCKKEALPPKEGWANFRAYIDALEEKYPYQQHKIKFLSDNPSFDIAAIDCELERYGHPILRRTKGAYPWPHNYRSVVAADDCLFLLSEKQEKKVLENIKQVVNHDHNPCNDAYVIYLYYVYAVAIKNGAVKL